MSFKFGNLSKPKYPKSAFYRPFTTSNEDSLGQRLNSSTKKTNTFYQRPQYKAEKLTRFRDMKFDSEASKGPKVDASSILRSSKVKGRNNFYLKKSQSNFSLSSNRSMRNRLNVSNRDLNFRNNFRDKINSGNFSFTKKKLDNMLTFKDSIGSKERVNYHHRKTQSNFKFDSISKYLKKKPIKPRHGRNIHKELATKSIRTHRKLIDKSNRGKASSFDVKKLEANKKMVSGGLGNFSKLKAASGTANHKEKLKGSSFYKKILNKQIGENTRSGQKSRRINSLSGMSSLETSHHQHRVESTSKHRKTKTLVQKGSFGQENSQSRANSSKKLSNRSSRFRKELSGSRKKIDSSRQRFNSNKSLGRHFSFNYLKNRQMSNRGGGRGDYSTRKLDKPKSEVSIPRTGLKSLPKSDRKEMSKANSSMSMNNWMKQKSSRKDQLKKSGKKSQSMTKKKLTKYYNFSEIYKESKPVKKLKVRRNLIDIQKNEKDLPKMDPSKVIIKEFGSIQSFAVNTHVGNVRNYNEDRVSILLNAQQRFENLLGQGIEQCSMFAVYDGHGGDLCCNFMKETFHTYLLEDYDSANYLEHLKQACFRLDHHFVNRVKKEMPGNTSGSCALALLLLDDKMIFLNVGDSRAILSRNNGSVVKSCTYDHKPQFFSEMQRIFKNKGQLYRVCANKVSEETEVFYANTHQKFLDIDRLSERSEEREFGPWRVKPGGLSVSRTFGDIEGKVEELGGLPGVVTPEPEITVYPYDPDLDFIILACDGIFDALTNDEVNDVVWETIEQCKEDRNHGLLGAENALHDCLNDCVNNVMKKAMIENSEDNLTVILIAFKNLLDDTR